jgi:hypothetical protein
MNQSVLNQLLFAAIQQKDVYQFEYWLKQGANPNITLTWLQVHDYPEMSPLFYLISLVLFRQFEIWNMNEIKEMLSILLQAGATKFYYKNRDTNALAYIASKCFLLCRNEMFLEDQNREEYENILKKEVDFIAFLLLSFLSHGFNPNEPSAFSDKNCIDWFVEFIESDRSDKEHKKYKNILQTLLCYGSNLPKGEDALNILVKFDDFFVFFDEWPQLMTFYCLKKKNKFIAL